MYGIVSRRKLNQARADETRERAAREFWPKLQQAPGFVSFSLIQGERMASRRKGGTAPYRARTSVRAVSWAA